MKYLFIANWDKWQSYRSDRSAPPWIKVHRNLMTNIEWSMLSDAEKGQLISLWIVASDKDGKIPADASVLQKICGLDSPPDLKKFIEYQFVTESEFSMTSRWRQDDVNVTHQNRIEENRKEKNREDKDENIKKISSLEEIESHPLNGHYEKWFKDNCPDINRFKKRDDLVLYCRSKGKKYKDYWATLQNWSRRDQDKIIKKPKSRQISEVLSGL